MGKRSNKVIKEDEIDIKQTIRGFVSAEQEEKTQEQEILDYKEKKDTEKLRNMSPEEIRKQKEKEAEEEERLKKIKQELLRSLKERIPEIEKKFFVMLDDRKDRKLSEKENLKVKEAGGGQQQQEEKKEENIKEPEQEEREQ